MRKIFLLLFAGVALVAGSSFFIDGNNLYEDGIEYNKIEQGGNGSYYSNAFFTGYINAISDAYSGIFFCPPKKIQSRQVTDIVFRYLQNHPENRNKPANEIALKALKKVWPCKSKINIKDMEITMSFIEDIADKCNLNDKKTYFNCDFLVNLYNNFSEKKSIDLSKKLCIRGSFLACSNIIEKADKMILSYKYQIKVKNPSQNLKQMMASEIKQATELYKLGCKKNDIFGCDGYVKMLLILHYKEKAKKFCKTHKILDICKKIK